jgi:hypothetical protein
MFLSLPDDVLTYNLNPYLEFADSMALREALQFKVYIKHRLTSSQQFKALTLFAKASKIYPSHTPTPLELLQSYTKCLIILKDIRRIGTQYQTQKYLRAFQSSLKNNIKLIQDQVKEIALPNPNFILSLPQTKPELESLLSQYTSLYTRLTNEVN